MDKVDNSYQRKRRLQMKVTLKEHTENDETFQHFTLKTIVSGNVSPILNCLQGKKITLVRGYC